MQEIWNRDLIFRVLLGGKRSRNSKNENFSTIPFFHTMILDAAHVPSWLESDKSCRVSDVLAARCAVLCLPFFQSWKAARVCNVVDLSYIGI